MLLVPTDTLQGCIYLSSPDISTCSLAVLGRAGQQTRGSKITRVRDLQGSHACTPIIAYWAICVLW